MDLLRELRLGGRLAVMRGGGALLALAGDPVLRLLYRPWSDDPYRIHRRLREGPQPYASRSGVMVVATAAACEEVVRDRRYGVRTRAGGTPGGAVDGVRDPLLEPVDLSVLGLDPPKHTRLRRLVAPAFTPARIAAREDLVARVAGRLVDEAARAGRFDLVADVAVPLPVAIIALAAAGERPGVGRRVRRRGDPAPRPAGPVHGPGAARRGRARRPHDRAGHHRPGDALRRRAGPGRPHRPRHLRSGTRDGGRAPRVLRRHPLLPRCPLARLEARVALEALATRMPRLRPLPGAVRRRSLLLSEFAQLPLDAGR